MQGESAASSTVLKLPERERQASSRPSTQGGVLEVYAHGLAFVDQVSAMRGYLSSCGWIGAFGVSIGLYVSFFVTRVSWVTFLEFALLFVFLMFIQSDWVGYRGEPVLFDQRGKRVHVFKSLGLPWWQWGWNLFGSPRCEVQSYDWACVRAEVVSYTIFTGQVPRRESSLVLVISDGPAGSVEVQRVGVGPSFGPGNTSGPIDRWEFIRRMMQGSGPVWTPAEVCYQDFGVGLAEALTIAQPLIGPGSGQYWRKGPVMWLLGTISLVALPLTAYIGLNRYVSYRLQRRPEWPLEVKHSLGQGPFSEAALRERAASADSRASRVERRR